MAQKDQKEHQFPKNRLEDIGTVWLPFETRPKMFLDWSQFPQSQKQGTPCVLGLNLYKFWYFCSFIRGAEDSRRLADADDVPE